MKKIIALLTAVIICFGMVSMTASAAVPTELTIKETKTAPNMNDGGKIDAAYGQKVFDVKATDHAKDSFNLYPSKAEGRDGHKLEEKNVKDAIKVMRNVGYMTYDNDNLYILCDVTDIAPKASANSEKYWHSTNLQLLMFINDERCFPTIAYEGTNKVKVWGDDRSVLDYELVECTFTEKSKTNFVYEIKIPWNAVPEVDSADDVEGFTMGIVQSSMANDTYVCSAFGEAYRLDAAYTIPVTMVAANDDNTNTSSTTSTNKDEDKDNSNSKPVSSDKTNNTTSNNTSSTGKDNTASTDKNNATSSTDKNNANSSDKVESTDSSANNSSTVTDSTSAPTTGTEIVTSSETTGTESSTEEGTEGTTTVITQEAEKDWTPIIIIGVVAVVIIAAGAVAIIMLNKKPKEDK